MEKSLRVEEALGLELPAAARGAVEREAVGAAFPKGACPVRAGERQRAAYLILGGLVRGYYLDEGGREVTKCFCREGEFFSTEGLRTGGASTFSVDCLEPCRCLSLPYALIRRVAAGDAQLNERLNALFLAELGRAEGRARDVLLLDAEQRYLAFCAERPDLAARVPLKYIASYIGIQPGSLSRIRKTLGV
ncbi:MAG: Crp/Fnr family transcriptional regulator [Clostridiales Family XIII bacterium]|jgi:CRP-like cAMP-binding protein|nr:Crp/Fnr family transcriptional regulator [Clostridiales Family XIII bacterium]